MPFFKKLKSSVFSSFGAGNKSGSSKSAPISSATAAGTPGNHHINGYLLNTAPPSLASPATPHSENGHQQHNESWLLDQNNSHIHHQTLNTTTSSSNNNPNNTTLSSLNSTSFFSKKDQSTSSFRRLNIYHIDSETEGDFSLTVPNEANGDFVMDKVCNHYNVTAYKEYFGLKYSLVDEAGDYEVFWLDPFKSVGKQLRDTKNNVLTFRIKHFPGRPELIESEYVRYLIFLQLRNYLLKSGDLHMPLHEEIRLAGYAVQAALGDYDPSMHPSGYLSECKFLSNRVLVEESAIVEAHKQLSGKMPGEMELAFLENVSKYDTYGAELIVVRNSKGVQINFGASHNGIITYLSGQAPSVAKINVYPWTQIGKISCDGKTLRIHAHTPNNKNSEIINKHVMVFKCNSKRICKHLWTFVLDQKAFFNFKRGADVPKIKSSKSFFLPKSKFRFSGRCESELISSQRLVNTDNQQMSSINNLSPISNTSMLQIDTSQIVGTNSLLNGMNNSSSSDMVFDSNKLDHTPSAATGLNHRYSTLQPTFKRRTFLSMSKTGSLLRFSKPAVSTDSGASTSPGSATGSPVTVAANDANNNVLVNKVDEQNVNQPSETPESNLARKNTLTTLTETSSNKSQLTVIVSNEEDEDDNDVIVIKTPVTGGAVVENGSIEQNEFVITSTPNTAASREDKDETIKVNGGTVTSDQTLRQSENETNESYGEDKFYDYREISEPPSHNKQNGSINNKQQRRRNLYSIRVIVLTFFFILFVCMLFEYVYCSVTHRNDQVYSCAGQMINTIRNNLLYGGLFTSSSQSSTSGGSNTVNHRYISWVNVADEASLARLDPLVAWFLGRRTPH